MPRKNKTACKRRKCQRGRSQRRRRNNNRRTRTIRGGFSPFRTPLQRFSEWNATRRTNAEARRLPGPTHQPARWYSPVRMWQERNRVAPLPAAAPSPPPPPAAAAAAVRTPVASRNSYSAAAARTPAADRHTTRVYTLQDVQNGVITLDDLSQLSPENRATILADANSKQRKLIQIKIDNLNGLIRLKKESIAEKQRQCDIAETELENKRPRLWLKLKSLKTTKDQLTKIEKRDTYLQKWLKLRLEIEKLDEENKKYTSNHANLQSQLANVGKPNRPQLPQLPGQTDSNDNSSSDDDDDGGYVVDNGAAAVEQSDDDDEFPELPELAAGVAAGVDAENIGLQQEIDDMVAQSAASVDGINSILSRPVGKVISDAELKREIGLLNLYDPKNQ